MTLFLVQNGVLGARASARAPALDEAREGTASQCSPTSSRCASAASRRRLAAGVKPAPLDVVVDQLAAGAKAIWH